MSETQSVCKWCQSLEHTEENCRFRPIKAVVTVANGEPVAEPASTGEPPDKSDEAFWKYLDENREVVIRWPGWMRGESILEAARPSGPSAPHCPECKTQLRDETAWYRCDTCHARYSSSMERGLYRLPDDRFAAPQTSAEGIYPASTECISGQHQDCSGRGPLITNRQVVDCKCKCHAAPHPVPRADGPEHPIIGPEDGSPCCEHCAKHPGSQWTLKVSQPVSASHRNFICPTDEIQCDWPKCVDPKSGDSYFDAECLKRMNAVSGDAPKVEEIAKKAAAEIFAKVFRFDPLRSEQIEKIILRYLRPYFPPASQTENTLFQKVITFLESCRDKAKAECGIYLTANHFETILESLKLATPASTARTDEPSELLEVLGAIEGVSGDDFCADLEMRNANRKLHGALATAYEKLGQIYRLSHGFNTQNSCHHVHTNWREELKKFAAPGSVPQAEPPKEGE